MSLSTCVVVKERSEELARLACSSSGVVRVDILQLERNGLAVGASDMVSIVLSRFSYLAPQVERRVVVPFSRVQLLRPIGGAVLRSWCKSHKT